MMQLAGLWWLLPVSLASLLLTAFACWWMAAGRAHAARLSKIERYAAERGLAVRAIPKRTDFSSLPVRFRAEGEIGQAEVTIEILTTLLHNETDHRGVTETRISVRSLSPSSTILLVKPWHRSAIHDVPKDSTQVGVEDAVLGATYQAFASEREELLVWLQDGNAKCIHSIPELREIRRVGHVVTVNLEGMVVDPTQLDRAIKLAGSCADGSRTLFAKSGALATPVPSTEE
jgi:hypothetical protein